MYENTVLNSMVQLEMDNGNIMREGERWVDLHSLMIPGLSKDIRCHVQAYCSKCMVQERGERDRERERDRGKEREVGGFGLMTPGLSKEFGVIYDHTVLNGMAQRGRKRERE